MSTGRLVCIRAENVISHEEIHHALVIVCASKKLADAAIHRLEAIQKKLADGWTIERPNAENASRARRWQEMLSDLGG
jgi:hypothetical protein